MLHKLLEDNYNEDESDFYSVPLLVVFPRRFAKTTLLGLIEAAFSPVPTLGNGQADKVRTKVAALECGKQILDYGWRPVVSLDLQGIATLEALKTEIEIKLSLAGLDKAALEVVMTSSISPTELLHRGVTMLNDNFEATFGVKRKTILLIDEYDKLFRDRDIDKYQENEKLDSETTLKKKKTVAELLNIFGVGKKTSGTTGVSLLVLCGLTRMVGSGLSRMSNLVDVSRMTKYHGLCGISARELVKCANGQLDELTRKIYDAQTFQEIVEKKFTLDWNGFRFGLDKKVGLLDPSKPEGALFSPLDVWEIVRSLLDGDETPSSRWIISMKSEFEFTTFAEKYKSSGETGRFMLYRNLHGGWVDTANPSYNLERENYLLLGENLHVRKVLFELGLLSVKEISDKKTSNEHWVRFGSPNWTVTRNAMRLLVDVTKHGITEEGAARAYLDDSVNGFGNIAASAAREVTNVYHGTGKDVVREYPFQDYLFTELTFRFPEGEKGFPECYKLYMDVSRLLDEARMFVSELSQLSFSFYRSMCPWKTFATVGALILWQSFITLASKW